MNRNRIRGFMFAGILPLLLFAHCLLLTPAAHADWSVTVSWTRSIGPGLAHEDVRLDAVTKCSVAATAPTTCQFVVPSLTGQAVVVRSVNAQGGYSETTPMVLSPVPAPATGVVLTITYVSP